MGARASTLRPEEVEELENLTGFTPNQIKRLYKRFKRLDKDNTGTISMDEFLSIPELAMNPLAPRVIAIFDQQQTDNVNFKQFVETLSVFRPDSSREAKIKFSFLLYDIDNDGFITGPELFEVLKMMVGVNIGDEQLQTIVDTTIREADVLDHDGKISFAEFSNVLANTDVEGKMRICF